MRTREFDTNYTEASIKVLGSIPGPIFGHVGDGNFHTLLLYDPENEQEYGVLKNIAVRLVDT